MVVVKVLLHISSNITECPEAIMESQESFAGFRLAPVMGCYRAIEDHAFNFEVTKPDDFVKAIARIPLQAIADQITKDFCCPSVYVQAPKVTDRGIFVTYRRGELERDMLFLKIVFEEPE